MSKVQLVGSLGRIESHVEEAVRFERLAENVAGVVHNLKSTLMAVNGYIDLLAPERDGEVYEHAKQATEAMEEILCNLVFGLRACRKTEPEELSLNACVQSTVELLRTNYVFQSKVRFEFELTENDWIYAVPTEVMAQLDGFIAVAAEHMLVGGQYTCTVATVCEPRLVCVQIGDEESEFLRSDL